MNHWEKMARARALILSVFILLIIPATGWATVYYVDNNLVSDCTSGNYSIGSRNCSGSDGEAYNTIQEAVNVAKSPGDTVYVRAGTYAEQITLSTSGTSGNYITYSAYMGETPVISLSSGQRGFTMSTSSCPDWIKINGFEISGGRTGIYHLPAKTSGCVSSDVIISDNYIHGQTSDTSDGGIFARPLRWTVTGNTIKDVTGTGMREIMFWGKETAEAPNICDVTITNNILLDHFAQDNVYIGGCINVTIQGNYFTGHGDPTIGHDDSVQLDCTRSITITENFFEDTENLHLGAGTCPTANYPTMDNTIVTNNFIYDIGGICIEAKEGSYTVTGNTFSGCTFGGFRGNYAYLDRGSPPHGTLKNNIFYNNGGTNSIYDDPSNDIDYNLYYQSGTLASNGDNGANSFSADPLFLNTSDPDGADNTQWTNDDGFMITESSPAWGGGENGVNIGAYPRLPGDAIPPMAPKALGFAN